MDFLSPHLDRMIQRNLSSHLPAGFTFERTQSPGLITYTLSHNQIRVGVIEIEDVSTPRFGAHLRYYALHVNDMLLEQISQIYLSIDQTIKTETGEDRWEEVPVPIQENQLPRLRSGQPVLYERVCETTPDYFARLVYEITLHYCSDHFGRMDYIIGLKKNTQLRFCFANLAPQGVICWLDVLPVNSRQTWIRLITPELNPDWFAPYEIEIGESFRQSLARFLEVTFGPSTGMLLTVEQKIVASAEPPSIPPPQPWERIPNFRWDRQAIHMWCAGSSLKEIALKLDLRTKTIRNRISYLRKCYPEAGIPYRREK